MTSLKTLLLFVTVLSVSFGQVGISGSLGMGYPYQWRGSNLVESVVVSPDLTLELEETGLWFDVWGAFARDYKEIDLTVAWDYDFNDNWGMEIVGVSYLYPGDEFEYSIEPGIALFSYSLPMEPSLFMAYDLNVKSFYTELAAAESFGLPFEIGLNYGFYSDSDWNDSHISLSLTSEFTVGSMTMTPTLGYALNLSDGDNVPFLNIILGM